MLLGRKINREKADNADELAEQAVKWVRPVVFVVVNGLWLWLLSGILRGAIH